MWIKEPGTITEHIEFLGTPELCTYLLKGDSYALAGGAMAHVVPEVLSQLDALGVDLERIRYFMLLHTHYDHVGMAPLLAQQWPWLKVAVSRIGAEVLSNKKALTAIQDYNNSILEAAGQVGQAEPLDIVKKGFPVHHILKNREELDLGKGLKLHSIDAPGHSVCSIALYVPRDYALFPSDGIGTQTEKGILPFGSSNYDDFQASIQKLGKVGAEIVCMEHFGALTPPDGREFLEGSQRAAEQFRKKMVNTYRETGRLKEAVDELLDNFRFGVVDAGIVPEDLLRGIIKRMVAFVNNVQ